MLPTILPMSQGGPGVRLARDWRRRQALRRQRCEARPHRRRRQALRRQRCTARRMGGCGDHCDDDDAHPRPLFTRPAWPRRTLRSHDHQHAPRKLSVHAVALCSPCAHHVSHYTSRVTGWTWYTTSIAMAAAASTATKTMRSPTAFHT